jgi:hypothetical protein
MLDWLGSEGDRMRIAFTKVFGSRWRAFGSQALQVGGFSDGREGVQWNVAYDPRDGRQTVGVNLEGMQYDDWPVARLIERELKTRSLPGVISRNSGLNDVELLWRRDYWQANSRPEIQERDIAPTPISLGALTDEQWQACLMEARDCLDGRRKRRGRAVQKVTLPNGDQIDGKVSPHLTFTYTAPEQTEWEALFRAARTRMQPVYDWTFQRAAQPIAF